MAPTANDKAEDFRLGFLHRAHVSKRNRLRRAQQAKNVGEPEEFTKVLKENCIISASVLVVRDVVAPGRAIRQW